MHGKQFAIYAIIGCLSVYYFATVFKLPFRSAVKHQSNFQLLIIYFSLPVLDISLKYYVFESWHSITSDSSCRLAMLFLSPTILCCVGWKCITFLSLLDSDKYHQKEGQGILRINYTNAFVVTDFRGNQNIVHF